MWLCVCPAAFLGLLWYASYAMLNFDSRALLQIYTQQHSFADFTPNWGLYWYFFQQMFDDFRCAPPLLICAMQSYAWRVGVCDVHSWRWGIRSPDPTLGAHRQGSVRMPIHCRRRRDTPPDPPRPRAKGTIVGKNEMYRWELGKVAVGHASLLSPSLFPST